MRSWGSGTGMCASRPRTSAALSIEQGILKPASPALLLGFCAYPIQQIFKETQKEKTMLPDVDFDQVFQMCWDAIKR